MNIQFNDVNIQRLFGFEDAESENIVRLREYYFKNDTYERIKSDLPLRILVGHKGVGKSALFKIAMSEEKASGNLPILIKPDDIAELGKSDENFLLKIRQWKVGLIKIIGSKVFSELGIADESVLGKLSQFGIKLINYIAESATVFKDKVSLEPTQRMSIENFLVQRKIVIFIDDLDRGWEGKKDDISRLSALLNAVRDISNENQGIQFKVALRTDVYFLVRTSDESTDKVEGSVVWYNWTNHEILVMLVKRILTYVGDKTDESILRSSKQYHLNTYLGFIMEQRFQGFGNWANAPMYQVLMSMTRKRPRDLVKLCTLAAREANKDRSNLIKTAHFQKIFEEYSQGRMQDTINEYRTELPNIEKLLFGMKPTKKEKNFSDSFVFTSTTLQTKLNNILQQNRFVFANGRPAIAKDLEHFLFKINFLTARKTLENGLIQRKYFEENRYLSTPYSHFGYDWEIHPVYRWVLQPESLDDIFYRLSLSSDE